MKNVQAMGQMMPGASPLGPAPDLSKAFEAETENLQIANVESVLNDVERRLLKKMTSQSELAVKKSL